MTNARSTATAGRAPRPNQANAPEAGAPRIAFEKVLG